MRLLGASLMCADFLQLGGQISELEKGGIDFYQGEPQNSEKIVR